jgi:cytochrome P450
MEATLLLAMIQQRYQLELVPNHPVEVLASVTLRPKHGIQMIAKCRERRIPF